MQMLLIMKDSRIKMAIETYMWIGICRKIF